VPAPLLTFYGDDFTGSSAVMEVLSFAGIPTMLFLDAPSAKVLKRFPDLQAIGVAGVARSKNPDWMRAHRGAWQTDLQSSMDPTCRRCSCHRALSDLRDFVRGCR